MNVLDESIVAQQSDQLRQWGIPFRQVGVDLASFGTSDENLIPLLHRLPQPTFFSHDGDFFKASLCHPRYALVFLDVPDNEEAQNVRRFLKHPAFNTQTKRSGLVARVRVRGVHFWRKDQPRMQHIGWD